MYGKIQLDLCDLNYEAFIIQLDTRISIMEMAVYDVSPCMQALVMRATKIARPKFFHQDIGRFMLCFDSRTHARFWHII